ncbi:MAG: HAMP domain-containing protein [Cytophagaceae bacterium]|nr:HAMP domain-containing protein [Gemmatimonadaceae bacterium]
MLTVAAFGVVAYRAVRESTIKNAEMTFRALLTEVKTISELGAIIELERLTTAASDPAVRDMLRHGHPASPATTAALQRLVGLDTTITVEAIDRAGVVRQTLPLDKHHPSRVADLAIPAVATVGPIEQHNDRLFFASMAPVKDGGEGVGAIRVTRRLGVRSANSRVIANRLGRDAVLLTGNDGGKLYLGATSLMYDFKDDHMAVHRRGDERWLGASIAVKGTPWRYAVELPERTVLAPARDVLVPFVLSGSLIAIAGALFGLRLSRRLTGPLLQLTAATEAIARGERDVTLVAIDRGDEIGRLARAFDAMSTAVRHVRDQLESEVDTRTDELRGALDGLHRLHGELKQSERFATLGRLSGSVGHELRNPLGVMSNVVFLIDALPDASPKLRGYATMLREQIRLSQRIITDLLDRARSGAPVIELVDVPRLLDDLLLRANTPSTLRVEKEYDAELPHVPLDRDQVGQIVWNLVTNAVQEMQGVGRLRVSAVATQCRLRITVEDSGAGVPLADRERIFEPLYTTKAEGVGLGLAISRAFARANGGDLTVEGADGGGACFVLEIPLSRPDGEGASDGVRQESTSLRPRLRGTVPEALA